MGPEKGRKVLLVHGISTACVALGGVANGLVEKGWGHATGSLG
jgi:hypothetical protein